MAEAKPEGALHWQDGAPQVDRGETASANRPVFLADRPLPFGVGRRCPYLLVSAVGVGPQGQLGIRRPYALVRSTHTHGSWCQGRSSATINSTVEPTAGRASAIRPTPGSLPRRMTSRDAPTDSYPLIFAVRPQGCWLVMTTWTWSPGCRSLSGRLGSSGMAPWNTRPAPWAIRRQ